MVSELELNVITTSESAGLTNAARDLEKAEHASDRLGESFHHTSHESYDLDREIDRLRGHLKGLQTEFARTGDTGLFKDIGKDRRALTSLERIQRDLQATARAEEEAARAGDKFDASGRKIRHGAHDLDIEISALRNHVRQLAKSYESTGDKSFLRRIGQDRSEIQTLLRLQRDLGQAMDHTFGDAANSARRFGMNLQGALIPAVAGLGVVLAPTIGAVLSGALAGTGVGIAMAGGILASIKSPAVKSAGAKFAAEIKSTFFGSGSSFEQPVIRSLDILARDFRSLNLSAVFEKVAPYVEVVAHGLGDLVKNAMPGLNKALEKAGPYSEVFAKGLGDTGSALGSFIADVSASPGALEGLVALFRITDGTIVTLGQGLRELSGIFMHTIDLDQRLAHSTQDVVSALASLDVGHMGGASVANHVLGGVVSNLDAIGGGTRFLHPLNQGLNQMGRELDEVSAASTQAAHANDRYRTSLQDLNKTVEDSIHAFSSLHGGILDYNQAMADLNKSIAQNGKTFDENTQAGRDNARAFQSALDAAVQLRQAQIDAGMSTDEATKKYDAQIDKLLAIAAAAGATKDQLDQLRGQYYIDVILSTATIKGGVASAASSQGVYDVTDVQHQHGTVSTRSAGHRAWGGSVMAGMPYVINERANKEVYFPANGSVSPANLAPAAAQRIVLQLDFAGADDEFTKFFRKSVRVRAGGDVQVYVTG